MGRIKFALYLTLTFITFINSCKDSDSIINNSGYFYNITGSVTDSSSNFPLHSALMICDTDTTITDISGFFEFDHLKSGSHQLKVFKEDYLLKILQIELHSNIVLNITLVSTLQDTTVQDTVDYFPLLIGNSWKYHRLSGRIEFDEEGIDIWSVTDTSKFSDGRTEYSIHSVFNGKNYSHITHDTTLIKDRTEDFIITESSDHLLLVPAYIDPYSYVIKYYDQFKRYYSPADPDTIKMEYGQYLYDDFKLYIKKDAGIVFSSYYYLAGNTHPYIIRTLIP